MADREERPSQPRRHARRPARPDLQARRIVKPVVQETGCGTGRTSGRNRGCSTSAISLSQAAVIAAFSVGDGLLPARPPTYVQTPLATTAPPVTPMLLADPSGRFQPLRGRPTPGETGFDHHFGIAVLGARSLPQNARLA